MSAQCGQIVCLALASLVVGSPMPSVDMTAKLMQGIQARQSNGDNNGGGTGSSSKTTIIFVSIHSPNSRSFPSFVRSKGNSDRDSTRYIHRFHTHQRPPLEIWLENAIDTYA